MTEWFDDDEFWVAAESTMFGADAIAEAASMTAQAIELAGVKNGTALDLCCGVGRHLVELAKRGFEVTGVDRTTAYLEEARRRAAEASVEVELVATDMRTFVRAGSYDLAINLFTSFGYFADPADDRRVLENLHTSLKPGGAVVIELMGKEVLARIFQARDWRHEDGTFWLYERTVRESWGWLDTRIVRVKDGEVREFTNGLRVYSGAELAGLCRAVGFDEVRVYGDLAGAPYDHQAQRLVVVARRS